jgi:hypothetical protein
MTKRGPLSKIEKFYIENNLEKELEELSLDLDRAKSVVKAYANKCTPKVQQNKTRLSDQIHSYKGSTIMTETASMISDDLRSNFTSPERKRPSCTTGIK